MSIRDRLEERAGVALIAAGLLLMVPGVTFVDGWLRALLVLPGFVLIYLGAESLRGSFRNRS